MMQRVDISAADENDIGEIAALETKYIPGGWSEKGFSEWLMGERRVFLKALCDGKIAGFLNSSWLLDEGELLNIAVEEKFRHYGIGRKLMQELFEKMHSNNVEKLFLEVREKNDTAIRFYRGLGFAECGKRKDYYTDPSDNAIIMIKMIKGE